MTLEKAQLEDLSNQLNAGIMTVETLVQILVEVTTGDLDPGSDRVKQAVEEGEYFLKSGHHISEKGKTNEQE